MPPFIRTALAVAVAAAALAAPADAQFRDPRESAVENREALRRLQQEVRDAAKSGDAARLDAALARLDRAVDGLTAPAPLFGGLAVPPAPQFRGQGARGAGQVPNAPVRPFAVPNGRAAGWPLLPPTEVDRRLMQAMEQNFAALDQLLQGLPGGEAGREDLRRALEDARRPLGAAPAPARPVDPAPAPAARPVTPPQPPLVRLGLTLEAAPAGGMIVRGVASNSPAAQAGIQRDDLLTRFAGKDAPSTVTAFEAAVGNFRVGGPVEVGVLRGGQPLTLTLELPEPPIGRN